MGEQFKEDPFILFQLRGRDKNKLLSDLAKKRIHMNKENANSTKLKQKTPKKPDNEITSNSIFNSPDRWWSYKYNLDDDLVVITTSPEETTGASIAGELPLAKDPKFPESHQTFIKNLKLSNINYIFSSLIDYFSLPSILMRKVRLTRD